MAVPEAQMEQTEAGLTAATEGCFVVNVRDAAWVSGGPFADACVIEGDKVPFGQIGYTIAVMQPGQASALYHREGNQEDFLVLAGECLLLVEGEERPLKAWDFVHCPAGTEHIFVGAGDGPCVVFMAGARGGPTDDDLYVRSEVALRHGAGVETDTSSSGEAYAPFARWRPGPPTSWDGLPWALR
jgi:uncharacterized cupin superfamily protein